METVNHQTMAQTNTGYIFSQSGEPAPPIRSSWWTSTACRTRRLHQSWLEVSNTRRVSNGPQPPVEFGDSINLGWRCRTHGEWRWHSTTCQPWPIQLRWLEASSTRWVSAGVT